MAAPLSCPQNNAPDARVEVSATTAPGDWHLRMGGGESIRFGGYALTRCEPRPAYSSGSMSASLLLRATPPVRTLSPPPTQIPNCNGAAATLAFCGSVDRRTRRGCFVCALGCHDRAKAPQSLGQRDGTMWGVGGGSGWSGLSRSKRLATRSLKFKPARLAACKRVADPPDSPSDAPAHITLTPMALTRLRAAL